MKAPGLERAAPWGQPRDQLQGRAQGLFQHRAHCWCHVCSGRGKCSLIKCLCLIFQLTFYYGTIDAWCPKEYYEDMKKDFPEGDIRLCEKKIPHAFILHFYQEMADMVADWLKDDLSKI